MDSIIYLSEVHPFKSSGKNLILDIQTSRVFAVDELAYDLVSIANLRTKSEVTSILKSSYAEDDIETAYAELKGARIIAEEPFKFDSPLPEYSEYEIRNMDLILSQDCNMRCIYCFADNGAFRGKRGFMSSEVGKRAIDFLIDKSGKSQVLSLVFFGGEPLMNPKGMKELVSYGNEKCNDAGKEIRYSISTNGSLLTDELIEYFNSQKIHVQISMDGDEETQNFNRPLTGTKLSYPLVKQKSLQLLGKSKQRHVTARMTITSNSIERAFENITHILSLGFYEVHTETAEGTIGTGYLNAREDYEILEKKIDLIGLTLVEKISQNEYFGYNNIVRVLRSLNANGRSSYACGAGRGYVAVGTSGDIFPCHRFVNSKYKMGNVLDGTFDRHWEKEIHLKTNVQVRVSCSTCWARFLCGGDCIAISDDYYNDLLTPNPLRCDLIRHVLETAMMVYSSIPKSKKADIENTYHFYKRGRRETPAERQI